MSRTYVISDLHGRFDLLQEAMKKIEEQAPHYGTHTVVTTGDYVDRGFESAQIISYLMNYKSDRFLMINLMGNHEDMMIDAYYGNAGDWINAYGLPTLMSYGHKVGDLPDMGLIWDDHIEWLGKLKTFHEDEHRIYVHGGIPDDRKSVQDQARDTVLWYRYRGGDDFHHMGKVVVHGHTPISTGPVEYNGRVNLDTGAYHNGRLVVGVFGDEKPELIGTIEIQGPTLAEWYETNKAPVKEP